MATVPDPAAARAVPAWRVKLERFWRWWSNELLAMVPERFAGGTRVPLLALEGGAVRLIEPRPGPGHAEERLDLSELDPTRAVSAVRGMLERAGESRGRVRLALSSQEGLVRRVTMPLATEENLGAVLGFEMDRLTPFRAEDVYYDHRVVARDAAAGTIAVLLGVARREVVEARLAQARSLGLSVQGVAMPQEPRGTGAALDVLPRAERGEREKPRERLAKQVLAVAAVLLLLAALFLPALRKRAEVLAIKPALDRAYAEAQATDTLIRDLERQVGDYNFLLTRKHATYPALAYVEEVTRLLPDNTWLQQMELKATGKAREVVISGETISSSKLIEILEQSRLLQNAAPRGTVTRGTQPGTERFVIAAEARARTQPEAIPVTQQQAPIALAPSFAPPQAVAPPPPVATVEPAKAPSAAAGAAGAAAGAAPVPPAAAAPAAPAPAAPEGQRLIFRPGGRPPSPVPVAPPKAPATPPKAPGK